MGPFHTCNAVLALGLAVCMATSVQAIELKTYSFQEFRELANRPARKIAPYAMRMFQPGCSLFEHANATGKAWRYTADTETVYQNDMVHVGKSNLSPLANDNVSSVKCDWQPGKRECGVVLYTDPNQSGSSTVVLGSAGVANLRPEFNDKVSSAMIICDLD